MTFVKLHDRMLSSSIMEEELHVRYVWHCLLIIADQDGYIEGTTLALARRFNVTVEQVEDAMRILSSPDPHSRSRDEDGRRIIEVGPQKWLAVNREYYRHLGSREESAEKNRERQRRFKARRRNDSLVGNAPVTPGNASNAIAETETETETETEIGEGERLDPFPSLLEFWNEVASETGLPSIIYISPARRRVLNARIKETSVETVRQALAAPRESPFLCGRNDRKWRASFDWIIKASNFQKVIEDNYRDRSLPRRVTPAEAAAARDWENTVNMIKTYMADLSLIEWTADQRPHFVEHMKRLKAALAKRDLTPVALVEEYYGSHDEFIDRLFEIAPQEMRAEIEAEAAPFIASGAKEQTLYRHLLCKRLGIKCALDYSFEEGDI